MEGLDKITARIEADARDACDEINRKADEEARVITKRFHDEADAQVALLAEKGARDAEAHQKRLVGVAALQSRLHTLSVKQDMIDEAFTLAEQKLSRLEADALVTLLAQLAARGAQTGQEELVFSLSDHTRYGKKVLEQANKLLADAGKPGQLTLSAHPRPLPGGLMLKRGDVEVNCTFAALLRGLRDSLTADVAKILFQSRKN